MEGETKVDIIPHQQQIVDDYEEFDSDDEEEELVSDCESCVTGSEDNEEEEQKQKQVMQSSNYGLFKLNEHEVDDGLVRLNEDEVVFEGIQNKLISNLGDLAKYTTIVAIQKKIWSTKKRDVLPFLERFAQVLSKECEDVTNLITYAWYGGSIEGIRVIMARGFSKHELRGGINSWHRGSSLFPVSSPRQSMQYCEMDSNGLRQLVLCRVLSDTNIFDVESSNIATSNIFDGESSNIGSSSMENDSSDYDVDVHVERSSNISPCILPEYVITFRAPPYLDEFYKPIYHEVKKPSSPWMSFPTLFLTLSKYMPQPKFNLLNKHYKKHMKRKISRQDLLQELRHLAGDDLLINILKSYGFKIKKKVDDSNTREEKVQSTSVTISH